MVLNSDFREFIELLNKNEVKYLVVGGYAVAYHGYPRYTKDIDLWIWINEENAIRTIQALADFGFNALNLNIKDFLDPENIIQLGYPPNRIDLIMKISGVDFENCYERKEDVEMDGLPINFIGIDDLITNKKSSGRLQDRADAEELEKGLK